MSRQWRYQGSGDVKAVKMSRQWRYQNSRDIKIVQVSYQSQFHTGSELSKGIAAHNAAAPSFFLGNMACNLKGMKEKVNLAMN